MTNALQRILCKMSTIRPSVNSQGEPPMLTSLLKQAADRVEQLETCVGEMDDIIMRLERRLNEQENFGQHD